MTNDSISFLGAELPVITKLDDPILSDFAKSLL